MSKTSEMYEKLDKFLGMYDDGKNEMVAQMREFIRGQEEQYFNQNGRKRQSLCQDLYTLSNDKHMPDYVRKICERAKDELEMIPYNGTYYEAANGFHKSLGYKDAGYSIHDSHQSAGYHLRTLQESLLKKANINPKIDQAYDDVTTVYKDKWTFFDLADYIISRIPDVSSLEKKYCDILHEKVKGDD